MTLSLYMKLGGGDVIVITSTRHIGLSQALLEDGELAVGT